MSYRKLLKSFKEIKKFKKAWPYISEHRSEFQMISDIRINIKT